MRIIHFAPFNSHTSHMFFDNKLLKFDDIICVEQLKLVFDFKNKNLPIELLDLFKLNSDINSHITRNVSKGGIFITQVKTTNFGIKSLRYSAAVLWNNFIKANEIKITETGISKQYLKDYLVSLYKDKIPQRLPCIPV